MKRWWTGYELLDRWKIERHDLASVVLDHEITAYSSSDFTPVIIDVDALFEDKLRWWKREKGTLMAAIILGDLSLRRDDFKKDFLLSFNEDIVGYLFKVEDIEAHEKRQGANTREGCSTPENPAGSLSSKQTIVNFFTKEDGDYWHLGFEGKEITIKKLDGLFYISYLLQKPGTSISCRELYQTTSGKTESIVSEDEAISEKLNIKTSPQPVNDWKTKQALFREYHALEEENEKLTNSPEDRLIREENEIRMDELLKSLQERTFVDPNNKKAQVNMRKRLETAYTALSRSKMEKLAKHLQDHIKPDGSYGLCYTGSLSWDIIIK